MAKKCIEKISEYYKIADYIKPLVFKTFNYIHDRPAAEKILDNLINICKSDGYKEGGLSDYDKKYMFKIIFSTYSYGYYIYEEYFKHKGLELLDFMTEKSVPALIEIAKSEDYKNKITDVKRIEIVHYIIASTNDQELNKAIKEVKEKYNLN